MLLDKSTFSDVRLDTYALFVDDLALYYYYGKALLKEFDKAVESLDTADTSSVEAELNDLLSLIREVHTGRTRILSSAVTDVLTEQGLDAEDLQTTYRTGLVSIEGHSSTDTILCPLLISHLAESKMSSTREALTLESDLGQLDGEPSEYVSAELVASIVGGTATKTVLKSGSDRESLRSYIESFNDSTPVRLRAEVEVVSANNIGNPLTPIFATSAFSIDAVLVGEPALGGAIEQAITDETSTVFTWIATRSRVNLGSPGTGTSGPMFEYPLSTSMVDTSLLLRPGMCLVGNTDVVVSKVLGERVTLTAPISSYGSLQFEYKACSLWSSYLPLLADIKVVGDTEEDRVNSLLAQAQKRLRSCRALLREIPDSTNKIRFDIRSAHHAVSADYAYNLLERGRLIEYHQLTEQQANRGDLMATAAAHIRAGTRL